MKIYTILIFIVAFALLIPSILLYKGESNWLKSFSKSKNKDKKAYSKYLGKCIVLISISLFINGLLSIFTSSLTSFIILILELIILIKMKTKLKF